MVHDAKSTVLVSGAGGFLGRHLIPVLLNRGHSVRALIRPGSSPPPEGSEIVYADLEKDCLDHAFENVHTFIHLAGSSVKNDDATKATENLLNAMQGSQTRRLIHLSSIAVYDRTCATDEINEESVLVSNLEEASAYTIAKIQQEDLVRSYTALNAWDTIVLRPGFIWGRGRAEIAGFGRRWRRLYLLVGPITRLPLIHVSNCSNLIATLIEHAGPGYKVFNAVDEYPPTAVRYIIEYIKGTRKYGLVVPVPYFVARATVAAISNVFRRLQTPVRLPSILVLQQFETQFQPIHISTCKLRKVIGWKPTYDLNTCLSLTYQPTQPVVSS